MEKQVGQKLKLIHLMDILREYTDENHSLTRAEITALLNERGIDVERKSFYDDISLLEDYGMDIWPQEDAKGRRGIRGATVKYNLASREFNLAELKLLAEIVQNSRFISKRKSRNLINKLKTLCSIHEREHIDEHLYTVSKAKTSNENLLNFMSIIQEAIHNDKQIVCRLFYNDKKKGRIPTDKPRTYSPFDLYQTAEGYAFYGYFDTTHIKDKKGNRFDHENEGAFHTIMLNDIHSIEITAIPRLGHQYFKKMGAYSRETYGIASPTAKERVSLAFMKKEAVVERFGEDVFISPVDDVYSLATVNVVPDKDFFYWLIDKDMRITGPQNVVDDFFEFLEFIYDYQTGKLDAEIYRSVREWPEQVRMLREKLQTGGGEDIELDLPFGQTLTISTVAKEEKKE